MADTPKEVVGLVHRPMVSGRELSSGTYLLNDCYRCITASQGSVATVRFGSKGHSGAT
jgi:hypothetical protein